MADLTYPPLVPEPTPAPLSPTVNVNPPMVGVSSPFHHVDAQNRDQILESIRAWARESLLAWVSTWQAYNVDATEAYATWLNGFGAALVEYTTESQAELVTAVGIMMEELRQEVINAAIPISAPIIRAETDKIAVTATADRFAVDPTGATDSAPGLAAAVAATPEDGNLIIPPGDYRLDSRVELGRSITVTGYGARLIGNAAASGIRIQDEYEEAYAVVAVNPVSVQMENDDFPTYVNGINLTVNTAPTNWRRGDDVKLYSDDSVVDARPASGGLGARAGQSMMVHSVADNVITVLGDALNTYALNVRVARYGGGVKANIIGLTFDVSDDIATARTPNNLVRIESAVGAVFRDITVLRATGPALAFYGCLRHRVQGFRFAYGFDQPGTSNLGYGILDVASSYGEFDRLFGQNVRHLYTDDNERIAAGTENPRGYGQTAYATITDSTGDSISNDPFDTHHGSVGTTFDNCTAKNTPRGFQLRGINQRILNSRAINCSVDIRIYTESTGGETHGHLIDGFESIGNSNTVLDIAVRVSGSGHPNAGIRDLIPNTVRNLVVRDAAGFVLYNRYSTLNVAGVNYHAAPTLTDNTAFLASVGGATVITGDMYLDYRYNTAGAGLTGFRLGQSVSSTNYFIGKFYVIGQDNARVSPFIDNSDAILGQMDEFIFLGAPPTTMQPSLFASGGFLNWRGNGSRTQEWTTLSAGAIADPLNLAYLAQMTKNAYIVTSALGANQTMGQLPVGKYLGQTITILHSSSTGNLTILHGETGRTSLVGAVDKVLTTNQQITLVWSNSSNWRQIGAVS